jgi:hypothetical protein
VTGDQAPVPADHCRWLDDQQDPVDLALENLDLVAQRQGLGVAPIASGQQQTQASDRQTQQARQR